MSEPLTISKKSELDPAVNFKLLWDETVTYLQQLSGNKWTDYNYHDPGVTIMEYLLYGLTEVGYKAGLDIEQIFAETLEHNPGDHLMFPANNVLPCAPVTINDYRKILIDAFFDIIQNTWITPLTENNIGEYRVEVQLREYEKFSDTQRNEVAENVKNLLNSERNTGELFTDVVILKPLDVIVDAKIELTQEADAEETAALINFAVNNFVSSNITFQSYFNLEKEGVDISRLYEGPYLQNGYIANESLSAQRRLLQPSEISKVLMNLPPIKQVSNFTVFVKGNEVKNTIAPGYGEYFRIVTEYRLNKAHKVELQKNLGTLNLNIPEVEKQLMILHAEVKRTYRPILLPQNFDLPKPQANSISYYKSIQGDFPATYGIGEFGLPSYAPVERKAAANQLKGYLLVFDQLMANLTAQVGNLNKFFSTNDVSKGLTYNEKVEGVQDIDSLIDSKQYNSALKIAGKNSSAGYETKTAVFDHLLARFGVTFNTRACRYLNLYLNDTELEETIINIKAEYLKNLLPVLANRGKAPVYRISENNSNSVIENKLRLLLGLQQEKPLSVIHFLQSNGIHHLKPNIKVDHLNTNEDYIRVHFSRMEFMLQDYVDKNPLTHNELSPEVKHLIQGQDYFTGGVNASNYYLHYTSTNHHEKFQLYYRSPFNNGKFYRLFHSDNKNEVYHYAKRLILLLCNLHRKTEQFSIIENLLLKPTADIKVIVPQSFFNNRISIILPALSARFTNIRFKLSAYDVFRQNLPAHLGQSILWLNYHDYETFEILYNDWINTSDTNGLPVKGTVQGYKLAEFIYKKAAEDNEL